jgi:hypothetical protein
MDLDDLLQRYFGTSNLSEASPAKLESGIDRLRVYLALKRAISWWRFSAARKAISQPVMSAWADGQ